MSATEEIQDAEVVGQELVPVQAPALSVTPQIKAGELVERLSMIREAMNTAMVENVDYGKVPGTDKPTLLKPGSEKLGVLFQLDVQIKNEQAWGPGDHLTVTARATAYHAPTGARLGYGEGLCTTRERKYAYRKQERTCPACGAQAIIKGKAEYGGGWLCWKKKGGCNAKFADGAQEIESQEAGEVENPDLPDLWNTVIKMAEKRARVDVVLAVTGASALFTQDAEDLPQVGHTAQESETQTPASGAARVTARPAQKTERVVTPKQRSLIFAKAGEKNMPPGDLANIVLAATESNPIDFESQTAAEDWLRRAMDRLPAKHVDAVLAGIGQADPVEVEL